MSAPCQWHCHERAFILPILIALLFILACLLMLCGSRH